MSDFKKMRFLFIALVLVFSFSCFASAETVSDYDAGAALKYAKAHCNEKKEPGATKADCIEFARTCVQAGGVPKDEARVFKNGKGYTVQAYVDYMIDNGYAELNKLKTRVHYTTDGSGRSFVYVPVEENQGLVAPGDIVLYKCVNKNCSKKGFFHASICAEPDPSKYSEYYRYYAHNSSVDYKVLCSIGCFECDMPEELYALHITSKANGYEDYSHKVTAKVKRGSYNKLNLSWTDCGDADGAYIFYKASGKSFWNRIAVAEGTSYTYTVSKDYYGACQYFMVAPYKVKDGKTYVGKKSSEVSEYTVPAAPSKVTLTLTDYRSVKVAWTKVAGATTYKVEYQPAGSSKWSFLYRGSKLSAVRKDLTAGKKYTFRVTTYTTSKGYTGERPSGKYKSNYIYTLKRLEKPAVKRATTKTVQVSWKGLQGADGYQISQSASTKKVGTTKLVKSAKTTKYKISAKKGKKYYYKVRAYKVVNNKRVYGPWSNTTRL